MTFVLFIAATIVFRYSHNDFSNFECIEFWTCFVAFINLGVRNGGGIGDSMHEYSAWTQTEPWLTKNFLYDWMFFVIVNIILLNIVFGIIIDTFAALRDEKMDKDKDKSDFCFVCGAELAELEKCGIEPDEHLQDHDVWKYLQFVVYLKQKDKDEMTGVEYYIWELIKPLFDEETPSTLTNSEFKEAKTNWMPRRKPGLTTLKLNEMEDHASSEDEDKIGSL